VRIHRTVSEESRAENEESDSKTASFSYRQEQADSATTASSHSSLTAPAAPIHSIGIATKITLGLLGMAMLTALLLFTIKNVRKN
jgi:hypothetical protein